MDTAKIIVERVKDAPIVTSFSYTDPAAPDRLSHFKAKEERQEFALNAAQAHAAVATGGFQVKEDSKSEAEETVETATDSTDVKEN